MPLILDKVCTLRIFFTAGARTSGTPSCKSAQSCTTGPAANNLVFVSHVTWRQSVNGVACQKDAWGQSSNLPHTPEQFRSPPPRNHALLVKPAATAWPDKEICPARARHITSATSASGQESFAVAAHMHMAIAPNQASSRPFSSRKPCHFGHRRPLEISRMKPPLMNNMCSPRQRTRCRRPECLRYEGLRFACPVSFQKAGIK